MSTCPKLKALKGFKRYQEYSKSGIETDWIEEEMSDDDDFRKDVIEQKIKKVLEEIGFSKKIVYKVDNIIDM